MVFSLLLIVLFHRCLSNNICNDNDSTCNSNIGIDLNKFSQTYIGEISNITLQSSTYQLKTISLHPLTFEIVNYLTNIECDEIINIAQEKGLERSDTDHTQAPPEYRIFDLNDDNNLDLDEMRLTIQQNFDVNLNDKDIIKMYEYLNIDKNSDSIMSYDELATFDPYIVLEYLNDIILTYKPWKRSRLSKQTWLDFNKKDELHNDIIKNVHYRLFDLMNVFNLPSYFVNNSHLIQIIKYNKNGKYNAHYDGTFTEFNEELQCCFIIQQQPCKSCRFMTILYYLNDDFKGGSTTFPLSTNDYINRNLNTIQHRQWWIRHGSLRWWMSEKNLPQNYCNDQTDNLKIKPEKGKAIIFFNHLEDTKTHWVGDSDLYAMHTGCSILKGQKWLANHWILVEY